MLTNYAKRFLSFALALIMVLGMVPAQVLAAEEDPHAGHDHVTVAEREQVVQLREMADAFVEKYEITPDMPESVLWDVYYNMDDDRAFEALIDMEDMVFLSEELTEDELTHLTEETNPQLVVRFYAVMQEALNPGSTYASTRSCAPIDYASGITVTSSDSFDYTNGVISDSASGSEGCLNMGIAASYGTVTLTVNNTYSKTVEVSFDVNVKQGTLTGVSASNGKATVIINGNSSATITVTAKEQSDKSYAEVELSNFNANAEVTFGAVEGVGSYTLSVNNGEAQTITTAPVTRKDNIGTSYTLTAIETDDEYKFRGWYDGADVKVAETASYTFANDGNWAINPVFSLPTIAMNFIPADEGGSYTVDGEAPGEAGKPGGEGYALVATPEEGYYFLGWYNVTDAENPKYLNCNESYTLIPTAPMTVKPVFAKMEGAAQFGVGSETFYSLNAADQAAKNGTTKTIVLLNDGVLPAGIYTISSGNTLLIPKDTNNTLVTTKPTEIDKEKNAYVEPYAFRTLQMADGAKITVNGAISVAGDQYAGGTNGLMGGTYGPVGFIRMDEGSKITVNGGAYLYTWGYIIGSGEVEVQRNGTVYESFQTMDWRGGSAALSIVGNSQGIFPVNQYYVQNIEVPVKLNAGAIETGYTSTTLTGMGMSMATGAPVPFVGPGALFNINSGYLIKDYDEAKDRQVFEIHGDVSMDKIVIDMQVTMINSARVDSSEYVLPLTCNVTVDVVSGNINITQDLAFLPGAEIYIREGAYCNLANGKSAYVYGLSDWGGYCGSNNATFIPLPFAPGRPATVSRTTLTDAKVQIDGTVNADAGFLYTTASGANVFSTGTGVVNMKKGDAAVTYQYTQSNTSCTPVSIPVMVAKLQNADHSDENPSTTDPTKINPDRGVVYTYTNGVWVADCPGNETCVYEEGLEACQDQECIYCDAVIKTDVAHTPGAAATCTEPQKCTVCGEVLVEALGHDYKTEAAQADQCKPGVTGYKESYICQRTECGLYLADQNGTVIGDREAWIAWTNDPNGGLVDDAEHNWGTPARVKDATCTEVGTNKYTCTVTECGFSEERNDILAKGHVANPVKGEDCKAATCTDDGIADYYFCSQCEKYYADAACSAEKLIGDEDVLATWKTGTGKLTKLGHQSIKETAQVNATCTDYGTKAYYCCEVCGKYYTTKTSDTGLSGEIKNIDTWKDTLGEGKIDYAAHTEETVSKKAATCLEAGHQAGVKCSVCHTVISGMAEIPQLSHVGTPVDGKTPECGIPGWDDYYKCNNGCNKLYADEACVTEITDLETWQTTEGKGKIPALEHDEVVIPAVDKTCTTAGSTAGVKCSLCNEVLTAPQTILASHTPAAPVQENIQEDGSYEEVVYCSVESCKEEISRKKVAPGVPTDHTGLEKVERQEPTCTEIGLGAGWKCTDEECPICHGTYETERDVLDAKGHTFVTPKDSDFTWDYEAKTCTAKVKCTACCEDGEVVTVTVNNVTVIEEVAPTCTADGSITYKAEFTETVLGARTKTEKNGNKLNHDWPAYAAFTYEKDGVPHNSLIGATHCIATQTCVNDTVDSCVRTQKVSVTGTPTAATCEAGGYTTYTADFTEAWAEDQTADEPDEAATGHNWEQSNPYLNEDHTVCTVYLRCTRCMDEGQTIKATSATVAEEVVTAPTCDAAGETVYTATNFTAEGYDVSVVEVEVTENPAKLAHAWSYKYEWSADKATCTATRTCELGTNGAHSQTETVNSNSAGGATCTAGGYITYTAEFKNVNGEGFTKQTEKVWQDALEHDMQKVQAKASTCKEHGNNEYYTCNRCGKHYKDAQGTTSTNVAAETLTYYAAHKYTDYTYNNDATCEKNGTKTAKCDYDCNEGVNTIDDPEHPATNHSYDTGAYLSENDKPTCTEAGKLTYTCQNEWCDEVGGHTYTKTVDALGHEFITHNAAESTCDTAGHVTYYQCASKTRSGDRTTYCGYYFANETDTAADATPIATSYDQGEKTLTAWLAKSVSEGGGALDLRTCEDKDFNHECDFDDCEKKVGEHKDADTDHLCDTYGADCTLGRIGGECADNDNDQGHKCDYCDEKIGDHVFTDGACTCGYVQDITVNITIKAEGQTDITLDEQTIKYGTKVEQRLDLSRFGTCYRIQSVSATVGGESVQSNFDNITFVVYVSGDLVTDNVNIIVQAEQAHQIGNTEETIITEATCTEAGEKLRTITCSKCNNVYFREPITIPKTGHRYQSVYTPPTFTANGYYTYTCWNAGCGDSYTEIVQGSQKIAVAQIEYRGKVEQFETLQEAIEAAYQGDTIEMLMPLAVEGTHVWDLTDITLRIAENPDNYGLVVRGDLTIKGGSFQMEGIYGIGVTANGKLTIEDGTFEVCKDKVNDYLIGSWGTTVINGGTFDSQYCCVNGFAGSLTVNGGTFTTNYSGEYDYGDVLAGENVALIKGGTFSTSVESYLADGYCQKQEATVYVVAQHVAGETVVENNDDPDCVNAGSYDNVVYCTRCEAELSRETVNVSATGHTVTVIDGLTATCTSVGYKEAYHCSVCNKYFATRVSEKELSDEITEELSVWQTEGTGKLEKLAHNTYTINATPVTCTTNGNNQYYKCRDCDNAFKDVDGTIPTTDAEEIITALDHDYTQEGGTVVTAPTCNTAGYTTYTCSRGDHTYVGDLVDALGHDYDEGAYLSEDDKPTCTETGTLTYTCKVCAVGTNGHTKTEEVAVLGHAPETMASQPAMCLEAGWKTHFKCTNCDQYFKDWSCKELIDDLDAWKTGEGKINALGHNITVTKPSVDAKCETAGYKVSYQCSRCNLYFSNKENETLIGDGSQDAWDAWALKENGAGYIEATGHTPDEVVVKNKVDASCTEPGSYDNVVYCKVCKTYEISRETVPVSATGHTEMILPGVDATCTTPGMTAGLRCSVCNDGITPQQTIPAPGHTEEEIPAVAPTCTVDGLKAGVKCSVCQAVLTPQTVDYAKGHIMKLVKTDPASCEVDGTLYYECENCDHETTEPLAALGHNSDKILPAVDATCTATGLTEGTACARCGETQTAQETVAALGHKPVETAEVAAKCDAYGTKAYYQCETCEEYYATKVSNTELTDKIGNKEALDKWLDTLGQGKIDKIPHTNETIPAVAPTCTEDGLKPGVKCSVCGETLVAQAVDPAKGHNPVTDEAVAPDCDDTGLTEGSHCSVCGETLVAQDEIAALGHTDETVPGREPTCTVYGLTDGKKCTVCGETTVKQTVIDAPGHTLKDLDAVAPTCTETGLTAGKHCTVCDTTTVPQDTIPAKGHTDVYDGKVDPTCTETGLTEGKHCSVCNETLVEQTVVPAKGHSGKLVEGRAAACEQPGWKDYFQCVNCRLYFVDEACTQPIENLEAWRAEGDGKLDALEHKWDNGRVTTLPTCDVEGVRTFTCDTCRGTKTAAEPATGHDPVPHAAQHPTYYTPGWEAYETCTRCDYSSMVGIPALGEPSVGTYDEFMASLKFLEGYANAYVKANPGKDPMWLLIKYIRTGVDRYNSGSWNIMAGYEDEAFAKYVMDQEEAYNKAAPTIEDMINVTGIKNIKNFTLPNGDSVDFGHMFGTMDISYHNKTSVNHHDVAGWAGDLVDLLSTIDRHYITGNVDQMIAEIGEKYLLYNIEGESDQFSHTDMYGDLDGFYMIQKLISQDYENGLLYELFDNYFTENLTDEQRADYLLKNRFGGVTGRNEIREAVFREYTGNPVIATLEGTREFKASDVSDMRKASCYAFADYLCKLAGDYVELGENPYFTVFSTESSTLAPGITQQISKATTADGKQVVYYTATADVKSPYVNVYANYKDNDPSKGWGMQRVLDQANAAQAKYGDPASDKYIENFNVIAAINGAGYNMTTGEPAGVLMMGGVEYHKPNGDGFVGILKDGSAYIGTDAEYYELKEQGLLVEAISGFGAVLVKDGKINVSASDTYYNDRASRTAFGITKTGKVVFMVMDGRQEPVSCGGSMIEIAQVMLEAGCVYAINLDGGGSTTYIARQEGDEELSLVSSPSDGFQRSVSTSLYMASTAPSSTAFDHAVLDSEVKHMTIGSSVQVTASGVSATGNAAELPEGATWAVSDSTVASISADGVVTGLANGQFDVKLMLGDEVLGARTMYVVVPDAVYFTKENMNAIYDQPAELPVAALYEGKPVAFQEHDVSFTLSNASAGTIEGYFFTGNAESGIKTVKVNAHAVNNPEATSGAINITMFSEDEASFDFDSVTGGNREFAWVRDVSNSVTGDNVTYTIVDMDQPMVTEYTFAIDMTQIPMPEILSDLVYMLPGADVEGNNTAWDFLLQLAERVSTLTEVKPVLKIDPNFHVDYSKLSINCEYFILEGVELNEETNELQLSLRWKDQTKAIDPDTANPMCILTGIKLTPKDDAAWDSRDRLTVINSGTVGYDIYLRANALYSFAQKPENQETFQLYPFVNNDVIIGGAAESGAHFMDTYAEFSDEYTMNRGMKNGWIYENGGYAYYVDDVAYKGVKKVGDFYYDFGETGINVGQTKFTGIFPQDGVNYYSRNGVLTSGWYIDGDAKYCFDENGKAYNGTYVVDEVQLNFENGLLVGGYTGFIRKSNGNMYHYQNGEITYGWLQIGDDLYHFNTDNGAMTTGTHVIPDDEAKAKGAYYDFSDDGKTLRGYFNNFGYYYWAGLPRANDWVKEGSDPDPDAWYHTNNNGHYVTTPDASQTFKLELNGVTYTAVKIAYDGVEYTFDNTNGKLLQGSLVYEGGKWYYYWAGSPVTYGWFELNGDTYYAYPDGHLATGSNTIDGKTYSFTPQGVLITQGVILNASLSENCSAMTIKLVNADENMSSVRVAMWATVAGRDETFQWVELEKTGDTEWTASVPLCGYGLEKADVFEIHAYGTIETEALITNTTVEIPMIPAHVYSNNQDTTCNNCGYEREIEKPEEPEQIPTTPMYRLYNPNSGEHFYTGSTEERDMLVTAGWTYEGIAWNAPITKGAPVYRVYNPNSGDHHYTMSREEVDNLIAAGWKYEGVAWNSASSDDIPQYRLYNPNADIGSHHYTSSVEERDFLTSLGWIYEGIGWFGMLK